MSFPTTQWGNVGNTLQAFSSTNPSADVYTAIPGPSATTPGSASSPVLGNFQILADGTFVQFLQTLATFNKALVGKINTTTTFWQNNFVVIPTAGVNELAMCVNDRSNTNLASASCTWFTLRGLTFAQVAASTATNKILAASATAGTLYAATAGTDLQGSTFTNTVVVGGSAAPSPVYMVG